MATKRPAKKPGQAARTRKAKKPPANPTPLRFAHPFFTPGGGKGHSTGTRMLDHIETKLTPLPKVSGKSIMTLADVIGQQGVGDITKAKQIVFHALGDSGHSSNSAQGAVAEAMAQDYSPTNPGQSPAFLYHLGDVIYHPNKDQHYREEFYEPYIHYPGKIIAIPGNHDGEVFPSTDPVSLRAFNANFCAASQKVPPVAGTIFRETMNQPGAYWMLRAPFVDIIGLYSNSAENPGFITSPKIGTAQVDWLNKTLGLIAAERKSKPGDAKALVIATHHPPYTAGGHSPSPDMLADIDKACTTAGVGPDLFLSGHAHSFRRYTRMAQKNGKPAEVPYLVAGTGGVGLQAAAKPTGAVTNNVRYDNALKAYGYLTITISAGAIIMAFTSVDEKTQEKKLFESVTLELSTMKIGAH